MSIIQSNTIRHGSRALPPAALRVEVIADLACPFCYLGKRHLDEALRAVKGPVDVSWYPFQLNPDIPPEGLPFDEYVTRRFGAADRLRPVLDGLVAAGRDDGIDFRFDRIALVPNTLAAHQVMLLAAERGNSQSALAESLMHAFFEKGENIGDRDVLVDIAGEQGMKADDTVRAIGEDRSRQIVLTREAKVRASGLSGVPGYLLNRRLLVVGAQPADTLVVAFDRAMFGDEGEEAEAPSLH